MLGDAGGNWSYLPDAGTDRHLHLEQGEAYIAYAQHNSKRHVQTCSLTCQPAFEYVLILRLCKCFS